MDIIEATSIQPSSLPERPELISSVPICLQILDPIAGITLPPKLLKSQPNLLPTALQTPYLYLNFLFWYSFYLYLLSTALTTLLNLGGCVTDYWYSTKAYPAKTPPCLTSVLLRFNHVLVSPFCLITNTFIVYLYHFISIDLQSSRLWHSSYCKAYIV